MKVTVFGLAGTGKTTVFKAIAEDLGWEFMSNGNLFRDLASERGMKLNEFEKLAESDDSIDIEVDNKTKKYGKSNNDFIFEGRLAWYFIPDSVKIKLDCGEEERIRRIAGRDDISIEDAGVQTIEREESIKTRYKKIYGIADFANNNNFDFVFDTTDVDIPTVTEIMKKYITSIPDIPDEDL